MDRWVRFLALFLFAVLLPLGSIDSAQSAVVPSAQSTDGAWDGNSASHHVEFAIEEDSRESDKAHRGSHRACRGARGIELLARVGCFTIARVEGVSLELRRASLLLARGPPLV
jgi:hypothetical protein